MKKKKLVFWIIGIIASVIIFTITFPFAIYGTRSMYIDNKYDDLKYDPHYSLKVETTKVELVTQHISCGYASIEMISSFYGNEVTEDDLSKKNNGNISTSSSDGFLKEINRSIPTYRFTKHSYLKNDQLLKEIHDSLSKNDPVAIEWAAKYEGEWTLHFSVVTGLDLKKDNVVVNNPYGYIENITVSEFISRTTFKAYKNIPFFLSFGFAFGAFEKNTIFFAY